MKKGTTNRIGEINFLKHPRSEQDQKRYEYLIKNYPLERVVKNENGSELLIFKV